MDELSRDSLHRFMFEGCAVRGKLVHLDQSWRAILERYDYPQPVRRILGETMAATVLLASTVKFEGQITVQIQGDGPLTMVVIQCSNKLVLRGLARWQGEFDDAKFEQLMGNGKMIISIENYADNQRYQGIVPVTGATVAESLREYFDRSEQLPTRLWLASGDEAVAGMLLQRMPEHGVAPAEDFWDRVCLLASTIKSEELLELPERQLLNRLFNEDDLRLFDRLPVSFRCSCNRERVENMLRSLGADEIRGMVEEQGSVSVHCEFCNKGYEFDRVDSAGLFLADPPVGEQSLH
ncbi:MAG: Hsp33 family molecular chaperone HslO [Gammaproteobacteria bacterium]|nr:Hsp33 family molecular chaperone HslO [Gammaproteobacteria bacterium]MCZ6687921.1 Hsp33 family molecular chaperone HslO [Gammaproteobacteria bacterium]MCZ6763220.1 Hsp33 family molecular chaperone HslO [Gammaproteobacteria bacterium]